MQRKIIHINIMNIHTSVRAHVYTNINGRDEETVASNTHTHTHIHAYIFVIYMQLTTLAINSTNLSSFFRLYSLLVWTTLKFEW